MLSAEQSCRTSHFNIFCLIMMMQPVIEPPTSCMPGKRPSITLSTSSPNKHGKDCTDLLYLYLLVYFLETTFNTSGIWNFPWAYTSFIIPIFPFIFYQHMYVYAGNIKNSSCTLFIELKPLNRWVDVLGWSRGEDRV